MKPKNTQEWIKMETDKINAEVGKCLRQEVSGLDPGSHKQWGDRHSFKPSLIWH